MLTNMKPELEIFRDWLKKMVLEDKIITSTKLAKKLRAKGFKASKATMSAYVSGRLIYGERKYTRIPIETRLAICSILGTSYQKIIRDGSAPAPAPATATNTEIRKFAEMVQTQRKIIDSQALQIEELRLLKDKLMQEIAELKQRNSGQTRGWDAGSPDPCGLCPVKLQAYR